MARTRLELQDMLEKLIDSQNVYYSPPGRMEYPCIKYDLAKPSVLKADNIHYVRTNCYSLTVIDPDPDSEIKMKVEELPMCTFDRAYKADNLNHFVYTLYF